MLFYNTIYLGGWADRYSTDLRDVSRRAPLGRIEVLGSVSQCL